MPLRDHFHPPLSELASWEEVHGAWPASIAYRLNDLLPPGYRSGVKVHLGSLIEVDVAGFETQENATTKETSGPLAEPSGSPRIEAPTLLLETEELTPPEYEVRVYEIAEGRRLVAAVVIVSPGNKDRPAARDAFVSKCHTMLMQDVCVAIIDPVTTRSTNLHGALAHRLGAEPPRLADADVYAVSIRTAPGAPRRRRVEAWDVELAVGRPLPTLPLWIGPDLHVPLELERTYEATCQGLRIP